MNYTEAYFIDHCEGGCGLGTFQYECPKCFVIKDNFEIWFKKDDIYEGETVLFKCENCKSDLCAKFNKHEYDYEVYPNE